MRKNRRHCEEHWRRSCSRSDSDSSRRRENSGSTTSTDSISSDREDPSPGTGQNRRSAWTPSFRRSPSNSNRKTRTPSRRTWRHHYYIKEGATELRETKTVMSSTPISEQRTTGTRNWKSITDTTTITRRPPISVSPTSSCWTPPWGADPLTSTRVLPMPESCSASAETGRTSCSGEHSRNCSRSSD